MLRLLAAILALASGCAFERVGFGGGDGDLADAAPGPDVNPCVAVEIAANASQTCARRADGLVWCWGNNELGQIAAPATDTSTVGGPCNATPTVAQPLPDMAALGPGDMHVCAVGEDTRVHCWGSNMFGQFGDGTSGFFTSTPTEINARIGAAMVVGGETHICHLTLDGEIYCAGGNDSGELGVGSRTARTVPALVTGLDRVATIASGYRHMCGVRVEAGQVHCWGANDHGQVTFEDTGDALAPTYSGVDDAVQVAAGLSHSCAVLATGYAWCWGSNQLGQLGDATVEFRDNPALVVLEPPIDAIAAGGNRTCALKEGAVYCWGESLGEEGGLQPLPRMIPLPGPAAMIASGAYHSCALLTDGSVWCWGWNAYGQRGDGSIDGDIDNTAVRARLCP